DATEAEGLPNRLEVLCVIPGRVEDASGADEVPARGGERGILLDPRVSRRLQSGAPKDAGLPRSPVVESHERVARKHEAHQVAVEPRAEIECSGGSLAGTAGDQKHRAARNTGRRQNLDVQRDRSRDQAGPVQGDVDRRALNVALVRARRQWNRCARLSRQYENGRDRQDQEKATTHEGRQGTSAPCTLLV